MDDCRLSGFSMKILLLSDCCAGGSISSEGEGCSRDKSPNVVWEPWNISREEREKRNGHASQLLWFTGISGAGKSTIAKELERRLFEEGKQTVYFLSMGTS